MNKVLTIVFICCSLLKVSAQSLSGNFSELAKQEIRLEGFNGLQNYTISKTIADNEGGFKLNYAKTDFGMGFLISADNKSIIVVLSGEDIEIKGKALSKIETIEIVKGKENQLFGQYASEHPRREQALSAWIYLEKIYNVDSLFLVRQHPMQAIQEEKKRIKNEDDVFLAKLPKDSYVGWFLPNRKLFSSVSTVAQYRPEEIPATINAFRKIDYSDLRLYKSGLLKETIESHYWLLENRGLPLDTIFKDMNISTDFLLKSVSANETLFNEITKYLFDYFEKHSLFQSAEYLALKALSQKKVVLNANLSNQLETYRVMKKGNTAPDILFTGDVFKNGITINKPAGLSELTSNYKVVIFGASWCTSCSEEMAQLIPLYEKWRAKGLEVVFVSLDTDKTAFQNYTSIMPFISTCDYKKWDTQAVKDYFVSSSPTIFLLDKNNKIILRPKWIKSIDTWVDYTLNQLQ
jgi:thiol-disulfide isomerase/thioredoxin